MALSLISLYHCLLCNANATVEYRALSSSYLEKIEYKDKVLTFQEFLISHSNNFYFEPSKTTMTASITITMVPSALSVLVGMFLCLYSKNSILRDL